MPAARTRGPLTDEQRELAGDPKHVRLARWVARRWVVQLPDLADELEAAAFYGLVLAARAYDPSMGFKFATYAEDRIAGAVLDWLREMRPVGIRRLAADAGPRTVTGVALRSRYGSMGLAWDRIGSGEEPVGTDTDFQDELDRLAGRLPGHYGTAIRAYFGEAGMTMAAIARRLGVTQGMVSYLIKGGLAMIRDDLKARGRA